MSQLGTLSDRGPMSVYPPSSCPAAVDGLGVVPVCEPGMYERIDRFVPTLATSLEACAPGQRAPGLTGSVSTETPRT